MGTPYIPISRALASRMDLAYVPRPGDNNIAFGLGPCSKMTQISSRHENQCWGSMPSEYYLKTDASAHCLRESNIISSDAYYTGNRSPTNSYTINRLNAPYQPLGKGINAFDSYTLYTPGARPELQKLNDRVDMAMNMNATSMQTAGSTQMTMDANGNTQRQIQRPRYKITPPNYNSGTPCNAGAPAYPGLTQPTC